MTKKDVAERVPTQAKREKQRIRKDGMETILPWVEDMCRGLDSRQAFYIGLEGFEE